MAPTPPDNPDYNVIPSSLKPPPPTYVEELNAAQKEKELPKKVAQSTKRSPNLRSLQTLHTRRQGRHLRAAARRLPRERPQTLLECRAPLVGLGRVRLARLRQLHLTPQLGDPLGPASLQLAHAGLAPATRMHAHK